METLELKRKYGDERRTVIHPKSWANGEEKTPAPPGSGDHAEPDGYLKRVLSSTYRAQHRGGKGVRGQRMTREDDVTPHLQVADTHDTLLFFTNRGRVFSSRVFELAAEQSRNARGTPVQNLINIGPREHVQAILGGTQPPWKTPTSSCPRGKARYNACTCRCCETSTGAA